MAESFPSSSRPILKCICLSVPLCLPTSPPLPTAWVFLHGAPSPESTKTLDRISKDFSPEADFKARGVTTDDFPGRYMYRDYGLKYWEATHAWVKEYLDVSEPGGTAATTAIGRRGGCGFN